MLSVVIGKQLCQIEHMYQPGRCRNLVLEEPVTPGRLKKRNEKSTLLGGMAEAEAAQWLLS